MPVAISTVDMSAPGAPAVPFTPAAPVPPTSVLLLNVTDVELTTHAAMLDGDAIVPGAAVNVMSSMSTALLPAFTCRANAGAAPVTEAVVPVA